MVKLFSEFGVQAPRRVSRRKFRTTGSGLCDRRLRFALNVAVLLGLMLAEPAGSPAQELPVPEWSDPDRPWVVAADRLLREGRIEEAARVYRDLSSEHPDDPALWLRIAYADLELGRTGTALEAARTAHELDPEDADNVMMLAQCLVATGSPQRGLEVLADGLRRDPSNTDLLEGMVSISIGLERWAEASGQLRELIRLHPERPGYHIDLGRILLNNGEPDAALESFSRAEELGGDPAACGAYVGKTQLAAGRLDEAEASFERSLSRRPNGDAHGGLGTVFFLRGELGRALQSFRKAVSMSPDDADLYFNLANVLAQTERLEEAEEAYRSSLRLNPYSATTHLNLGIVLLNRFAVREAEEHLLTATELDPGLARSFLYLGRIAGASYRYEDAIGFYEAYRDRVEELQEQERIDGVLAELRQRLGEARTAIARGEVHLLQMVCETEDQARRFLDRVRSGEDFFVLAQQQSKLRDIAGADVGFVDPRALAERFVESVAGLERGELTDPIRAENGDYVIFQRVE